MSGVELLSGGAAALEIAETILRMVQEARKEGKTLSVSELVGVIPIQTAAACENAAKELRALKADLISRKVEIGESLEEIERTVSFWRVPTYNAVRRVRRRIEGLKNDIVGLHSDFVASAQCLNQEELLIRTHRQASEYAIQISVISTTREPLGSVLDRMAERADKLATDLKSAAQPRPA